MRLFLDTEAMLWSLDKDSRLSASAETAIVLADEVYVCSVSFLEVAIKLKISRKIQFSRPVADLIQATRQSGFIWLPISAKHLTAYDHIPFYDDHRDPFDRMILATAFSDGLTVVSSDQNFPRYSAQVPILW